jgi:hypothetical protein
MVLGWSIKTSYVHNKNTLASHTIHIKMKKNNQKKKAKGNKTIVL